MKRKMTYGVFAFATMAVLLVGSAAAFGGFGNGIGLTDEEKAERDAFREQVREAVENEDYEAWQELMQSQISAEQFEEVIERHAQMSEFREIKDQMREARESGDTETFEELRAQLHEMMPEKGYKAYGKGFKQGAKFGHNLAGGCPYAE